jgi:hypothetical protein
MTFLETLQAHKGGLLRLKTELFWYGGRGCDNAPDRTCLILSVGGNEQRYAAATWPEHRTVSWCAAGHAALLLIDGSPQWVWVAEEDVEIMLEDPSTHTHACMLEVSNEQKRQRGLGSSRASAD